jgi:hypothetical protein
MVQLLDSDIKTRKVFDWKGVHLLHFDSSSCSRKTRILLNLKGIDWISRPVDPDKQREIDYWTSFATRGITDEMVRESVAPFPCASLGPIPSSDRIDLTTVHSRRNERCAR